MNGLDAVLVILIVAGTAGALVALAGLWCRKKWVIAFGFLLAVTGFGFFELVSWRVVPRPVVGRVAAVVAPTKVDPQDPMFLQNQILLLDQAAQDTLPLPQFTQLLDTSVGSAGRGPMGFSAPDDAIARLRNGQLPQRYADALIDWLISHPETWRSAGGASQIPATLLESSVPSVEARGRFRKYILASMSDPAQPWLNGGTVRLDAGALDGSMDKSALEEYLVALADVSIVQGTSGPLRAGDVATIKVRFPHKRDQGFFTEGSLPWHGSVQMVSGAPAFEGKPVPLGGWVREQPDVLANILVPDDAGEHELVAQLQIDLTKDDLRDWFGVNPHLKPPGFDAANWEDVHIGRWVRIKYTVQDGGGSAPDIVTDESLAGKIREQATMDVPFVLGSGASKRGQQVCRFGALPITLAADVVWATKDQEATIGWVLVREGEAASLSVDGPTEPLRGGPSRIILRPNLSLIKRPRGVQRVYNGPPIEFPNTYVHY